ncbi:MAG TPA: TIGR02266 family protein, partial [Polyangia bacterium]|nr:TIGR02266 family protein [Polyangia bacterium]
MAGQDSRVGDRQTASMRIKLKYPDIDTFIQKYAVNISRGGIFIATKSPKPVGTYVRFEFLLSDASGTSIIRGEGQVQWTKDYDPATPGKPHGMGVKFMRLDADSQTVVDRALRWRADHGTSPNVALPPTAPVSSAHMINTRDDFDRTSESPPLDQQVNDPERTARVNVPELLARTPKRELPPDEALDTERVDLPGMLARAAVDELPKQDSLPVPPP